MRVVNTSNSEVKYYDENDNKQFFMLKPKHSLQYLGKMEKDPTKVYVDGDIVLRKKGHKYYIRIMDITIMTDKEALKYLDKI